MCSFARQHSSSYFMALEYKVVILDKSAVEAPQGHFTLLTCFWQQEQINLALERYGAHIGEVLKFFNSILIL